jgi:colanic acid biosynthesis glycosyl transferase WcaI
VSKVIIHSIAFSPDGVSTAYLYNDIALELKSKGYDVVVVSTTPHFNVLESEMSKQPLFKHFAGLYFTSNFKGINVFHIPQKKFKSTLLRLIGFVWWHLLSFFIVLLQSKVKVIISPSPPLTIAIINIFVAKLKSAKTIYNVQEIYPDLLIEEGGLKSTFIISVLKKMERFVYQYTDAVCTIDEIFYNTIVPRFRKPNKLSIIPNFVDTELYFPISKPIYSHFTSDLQDFLIDMPNDVIKVVYAGNIGHAQDWDMLLKVAEGSLHLKIVFLIIGEGVVKNDLYNSIKVKGLKNVHLFSYQKRESMPHLLAISDLQFIFMSTHVESHGFPSKVYTVMACAKPLIVSSGKNTPIVNFLSTTKCAFIACDTSSVSRVEKIIAFLEKCTNETLREMGEDGSTVIAANYSKFVITKKYEALIKSLV